MDGIVCINKLIYNYNNNIRKKHGFIRCGGGPHRVLGSAAVAAGAGVWLDNNIKSMRKWWAACAGVTIGPVHRVR